MQLLDQLVPDLSDEFRVVSYYFNHEPDTYDDGSEGDSDSNNSRYASAEDIGDTVPFRHDQVRPEPCSSATGGKVLDTRNLSDQKGLQRCDNVGHSSAERKLRSGEFIEMESSPDSSAEYVERSLMPADEEQRVSRRPETRCLPNIGEPGSKESSGSSSQGSYRNGYIKGSVIPFHGAALPSQVH